MEEHKEGDNSQTEKIRQEKKGESGR